MAGRFSFARPVPRPSTPRRFGRGRFLPARFGWAALALAVLAALLTAGPSADAAGGRLSVTLLSSRPDTVSGGDALVQVAAPARVPLDHVRVTAGRRDVTGAFHALVADHVLQGVVDGLAVGTSRLTASVPDGAGSDTLTLVNHPRTGPVFSGPQQQPFICDTAQFTLVNGEKLGPPQDRDCSVVTRTDHVYRTTAGKLVPLPAGTTRPADLAWTTTSSGERVPYIVRVETGTMDRAVYEISMLADPEDPAPDPWRHSRGWNGKLIYTFGGGCPGGWYIQGRNTGGVTQDGMLKQGYAVASSSLNVFGNNCNDLLASEAMAMVKEHFTESYGVPAFTIGWGCSGGSYQSHQIGDNYPGLLDGIIVGCSFPDVGFATVQTITDARLLDHYFQQTAPGALTREQQRAVAGFGRWETIATLSSAARRIDPRVFCPGQLPAALRYDPQTNPGGARCDVYDATVNAYGSDPETGFARRPLDNTGIEYGRQALRDQTITVDQFLDLNERIGGFGEDADFTSGRTVADDQAVRAAYRTGRMLNGGQGLAAMPIIDHRDYTDDAQNGDIHLRFQSFSTRARLEKANGTSANQVMLAEGGGRGGFSSSNPILQDALGQMDSWLTGLKADTGSGSPLQKVVRNKPGALTDACWTRGSDSVKIVERQEPGIRTTRCNTEYPVWPSPRMVAGGTLANDVIKCRLQPADPATYGVPMTGAQTARLRRIFPHGVCDWSRPGRSQQKPAGTWQFFGDR